MARIRLGQVASESPPPAGQLSIYSKTDDQLYFQNSAGLEFLIANSGSPGFGGYQTEQHLIDMTQLFDKEIILSSAPVYPERTLLLIDGAGSTFYGVDFTVTGNVLSWESLRLDGLLGLDDRVQIIYF